MPLIVLAQTIDVRGVVVDATGSPLPGAVVKIKGTDHGVSTDIDGNFMLPKVPNGSMISASLVGMETSEAKAQPNMRFVLQERSEILDEVLVVAFGKQKREAFTGSAGVLKSEDISKQLVNDPVSALDGTVAGIQIQSGNDPASSPSITIRGIGTINASSEPLIIVDGMPYNGYFYDINPADVENISVLKDAASNALYGARGANGVIIITTKNPQKSSTRTTFDAKWGVNTDSKVDYNVIDNPGEYYEAHYLALRNYYLRKNGMTPGEAHVKANNTLGESSDAGGLGYLVYSVPQNQLLIGSNGKLNPNAVLGNVVSYDGKQYMLLPDNWREHGLRDGFRQEYNFNISGGNEKSSFYASIGYLSNEGITYGSKLERFTTKIKADYQAYSWLKVGANTSYTSSKSDAQNESFNVCHNIAPIFPLFIRDGNGQIMTDEHGLRYDYGDGSNAGLVRTVEKSANSIQTDRINTYRTSTNNFNIQGFANIDFLKDFRLTINASTFIQEYRTNVAANPYYGYSGDTGGSVWVQHFRNTDVNFQQLLNWNHQFGNHNAEVLIGHEYNRNSDANISGSKTNVAIFEDNIELDGAVVNGDVASSTSDYNVEGYFIRGQYDYDSRYFASASFRRDGSSRFHPKHRWGNFWSVGAAWIITKEEWFPKTPMVNMLKVKASYGEQGNDNIGDFLYTDYYEITNSNDEVAILFKRKGNPNITWETVGNFNTGVEFDLLNSRLSGSVEYYHRKTTNMLTTSQVPASLGYSYYWANIGADDTYSLSIDSIAQWPGWYGRRVNATKLQYPEVMQVVITDCASGDTIYIDSKSPDGLFNSGASATRYVPVLVPKPRHASDIQITVYGYDAEGNADFKSVVQHLSHDTLEAMHPAPDYTTTPYITLRAAADPKRCINLALLAEGYAADEMDQFCRRAMQLDSALFSQPAFRDCKAAFNVVAVMLPSAESGITVPSQQQVVNSALASHFDSYGLDRLLTVPDSRRVWDALEGIPASQVLILANTDRYGGSGSYNEYAIASADNKYFTEILIHEFGHSFVWLGDEYESGYSIQYTADIEPMEPNITTLHDFSDKWQNLIDSGEASLIEGAGYQKAGVWRGCERCLMRDITDHDFCAVCAQAIRKTVGYYTRENGER